VAESVPEALRCLDTEPCHVLLTDSLALTRRVRALRAERHPVVLFALELEEREARQAALDAGADDCISWRAHEEELHARISLARRIAELETCLRTTLVENRKLSAIDELTGLASRRFFAKHFPQEVQRAGRYGHPLSLILCDIDHFKQINDTFGHVAGDAVLKQFGARLQSGLRQKIDWVARLGGEEFAIVLPETPAERAAVVANKLRASIAEERFPLERGRLAVTASFGVCGLDKLMPGQRKMPEEMVQRADAAMYRAKRLGRNRVDIASSTEAARVAAAR
jgi:diguanylate cyclase (GGDEF)-like protein